MRLMAFARERRRSAKAVILNVAAGAPANHYPSLRRRVPLGLPTRLRNHLSGVSAMLEWAPVAQGVCSAAKWRARFAEGDFSSSNGAVLCRGQERQTGANGPPSAVRQLIGLDIEWAAFKRAFYADQPYFFRVAERFAKFT